MPNVVCCLMVLSKVFEYFNINKNDETDRQLWKTSDDIGNGTITHIDYEKVQCPWVLKHPATRAQQDEDNIDEEAIMKILTPSLIGAFDSSLLFLMLRRPSNL